MARGPPRWQPPSISTLGLGLLFVTGLHLATDTGTLGRRLFESAPPVVFAVAIVAFGGWLGTTDLDDAGLTRVAGWCAGATVAIGAISVWAFVVMTSAGLEAVDASFIVVTGTGFGGFVGCVAGLYDARQHASRRRAEHARTALDASNDGIATFDDEGRLTMVNQAFAKKYGFEEAADLVGESWERIVTEETMVDIESEIGDEVRETGAWRGEVTARRQDGTSFPVEMSVSSVDDEHTVAVVRDITERRSNESAIRYHNSLLEAQLEASRDGILILDDEWQVLECNDQFLEMWGLQEATVSRPGFDVREAIASRVRDPEALQERVQQITDVPDREDRTEIHLEDGRIFDRYSAPVVDEGTYYGRVFTYRDVTSQWRYERAIESLHQASRELTTAGDEEELARTLVDIAEEVLDQPITAYWRHDVVEGELVPVAATERSRALVDAADLDGLPRIGEQDVEMDAFRLGVSRIVDRTVETERLAAPGMPLDSTLLVPVGEHGLLGIGSRNDEGFDYLDRQLVELLAGNARAAFDRVERSRALAESEQRLRTIVENVPIVLFAFDDQEVFTLSEGHGLRGIGLEPGEAVGDPLQEVFAAAPGLVELCQQALEGESIAETVTFAGRAFEAWLDPVLEDGEVAQVIGTAVDVTERERYAGAIEALHHATREMVAAQDAETVCEVTTRTARDVLGHSLIGVWLADEEGNRLRVAGTTEEAEALLGPQRAYQEGEGLTWEAFESGETLVFDDVRDEAAVFNPDTPVRSELYVPIGGFGVLTVGAEEVAAFDENDVALIELLAENAAVAIERTRRQQVLEQQTDQMEFFNSILRHDVLNGMTVIRSRAEFLEADVDGEQAEYARTIVAWCDDIVQIIGRVRRVLETLTSEESPSLEPVDLSAVVAEEVRRVEQTYDDVTFSTDLAPGVWVLADELLSDVLGNVVTNAVEHNDRAGLAVDVTVTPREDTVEIRVTDSGRGVEDEMKEAIFRRDQTGHAKSTGSGFGLFFVDAMVSKYGGDIRVEDNDRGGATFALELERAPPTE